MSCVKRKDKICRFCSNFILETEEYEAECLVDEDIDSTEFCESMEKRGRR